MRLQHFTYRRTYRPTTAGMNSWDDAMTDAYRAARFNFPDDRILVTPHHQTPTGRLVVEVEVWRVTPELAGCELCADRSAYRRGAEALRADARGIPFADPTGAWRLDAAARDLDFHKHAVTIGGSLVEMPDGELLVTR